MEKTFVTKKFELTEELMMVCGKKVGYQYTLRVIGPSVNIEDYTLDALLKHKCCNCCNVCDNGRYSFRSFWSRIFKRFNLKR